MDKAHKRAEPSVIFEDRDFIVINKPAGLLVHRTLAKREETTLVEWILARYPEVKSVGDSSTDSTRSPQASSGQVNLRPGIVHRLDRETSGVMLVARSQKGFTFLKQIFQKHEIKKTYLALVWGRVKDKKGSIKTPIGLKTGTTRHTVRGKNVKLMKEARTDYRVLKRFGTGEEELTLLTVMPQTGRTHQIRVHLASIGYPVVGDALYGGKARYEKSRTLSVFRQFLHADSIEFTGPDGSRLRFSADLPSDLSEALALLLPVPLDSRQYS